MKLVGKILKYEIHNTIRSKWVVLYTLFFFIVGYSLFSFTGDANKAYISLMNIVIFIIPLVSLIFGAIYLYNSREFIEMMLSQPIDRKSLISGIYFGTCLPLSFAFVVGILVPFLLFSRVSEHIDGLVVLLLTGVLITFIFTALSFFISVLQDDKAKGIGFSILLWLILAVIYDGIVLFIVYYFEEYPLEKIMIALSIINPIDLGRILFLMKFDVSALMGYTGAVFKNFFGSYLGMIISFFFMLMWIAIPFLLSLSFFKRKDF